ncbi:MAG: L-threonylcarbamoyladenylate synthase [Sulfurifustaceae bacterium]
MARIAPILRYTDGYLPVALEVLGRGGLVISPTTTNYNLICDATNEDAVERVFQVKRRTKFGPLPVSLPYPEVAPRYVDIPDWFDVGILRAMLPGEISFIFRQKYPFPDRLTCGLGSVAISCTTHPVFRSMVIGLNRPIAATSANLSGQGNIFVPLDKAIADIGAEVDLIIDAGPTAAEIAGSGDRVNTIIDLTFDVPYLVRPGWVPLDQVRKFFPNLNTDIEAYQRELRRRVAVRTPEAGVA